MNKSSPQILMASTVDLPAGNASLETTHDIKLDLTEELRRNWETGRRIPAEVFVRKVQESSRDEEVILDLIFTEFVVREELGESPATVEYLKRFPEYSQRLERLFAVDRAFLDPDVSQVLTRTVDLVEEDETPAPKSAPTAPGQQMIGRYPVVGALDGGGQGLIFRGVHPTLGREVVIKLARRTYTNGPDERDRLIAEGHHLAALTHPHIARIYDLDFHEDRPFLVLEYIPGRHLEQLVKQEPPTPQRAAWLTAQVARALSLAHHQGVQHRDLKPRNILIDEQGHARLIDFGLARLQGAWKEESDPEGAVMGSVQFMAPEQARGENQRVGPRSDLFALGGVLYYLLTGKPLYKGKNFEATLELAKQGQPDLNLLDKTPMPAKLRTICKRLLQTEPEKRYTRGEDVARDLEAVASGGSGTHWGIALGVFSVLALAGVLSWAMPYLSPPVPPAALGPPAKLLHVDVYKGNARELLQPNLRVGEGTQIQVRAEVPAGLHAALFVFDSSGHLELLKSEPPRNTNREIVFPGDSPSVTLDNTKGTEFFLLLARKNGAISADEVEKLWGTKTAWPQLPSYSVLRVHADTVRVDEKEKSRGVIKPERGQTNPEAEVRQQLETLRTRLAPHFDYLEGLAFGHQ